LIVLVIESSLTCGELIKSLGHGLPRQSRRSALILVGHDQHPLRGGVGVGAAHPLDGTGHGQDPGVEPG
jgi:S-formylglutathione hydrolase FrmB